MSKKSGSRRKKDQFAKNSDEVLSARTARRYLYTILATGIVIIPVGFSWVLGTSNAYFYMTIWLAAILAVGILWAAYKQLITLVYTPFFLVLAIWLAAKLITTITSIYPYHSFWGTYLNWSDGFIYALAVAVIAAATVTLRLENRRIIRLVGLLTAEAVLFSAITIGQAVADGFFYQKVRPVSPLGNADFFLSYLLLFLPMLLVLLVIYIRKRRWWRVGLYGTGSVLMLLAIFVSMPTHLQTILLPAFESGKVDTSGVQDTTKTVTAGNFTQDEANIERWTEWKYGLQFGLSRPLVGTGPSTTGQAFVNAIANHSIDLNGWNDGLIMDHSHNDMIEQFSQEGLLGLLGYLALWGVFIGIMANGWRNIETKMRPFAIGLTGGLLLWFGFNQLLFTTIVSGVIVMVWAALLLTMVKSVRSVDRKSPLILVLCISAVLLFASFWVVKYLNADSMIETAIQNGNQTIHSSAGESASAIEQTRLFDETLTSNATNQLPDEPYFSEEAAIAAIEAYPLSSDPIFQKTQAENALKYSRRMLSEEPNSAEYLQVAGTIEYLVAPSGSMNEKSGLVKMNQAISYAPNYLAYYLSAAENASNKKDYQTARLFVNEGMLAPLTSSQKSQLEKLAMALPDQ